MTDLEIRMMVQTDITKQEKEKKLKIKKKRNNENLKLNSMKYMVGDGANGGNNVLTNLTYHLNKI